MRKYPIIRYFLAGFFLLLFAFSITPRLTLHNIVANHKEGRTDKILHNSSQDQLSKTTINCLCDNLVAESPFVGDAINDSHTVLSLFHTHQVRLVSFHEFSAQFSYSLRGPPAC